MCYGEERRQLTRRRPRCLSHTMTGENRPDAHHDATILSPKNKRTQLVFKKSTLFLNYCSHLRGEKFWVVAITVRSYSSSKPTGVSGDARPKSQGFFLTGTTNHHPFYANLDRPTQRLNLRGFGEVRSRRDLVRPHDYHAYFPQ